MLATPVVLWAGWPFFQRGWASVVSRNLNMFTLIAIGTGIAWIYSLVATLAPQVFPAAYRGGMTARSRSISRRPPSSPCWSCSARCWSCAPATRTGGAIRALLDLAPKTARRIEGDGEQEVPLDQIQAGDTAARAARREGAGRWRGARRQEHARRIHGDRRIHAGREGPGDTLIGGTLNTTGSLIMRADKVGSDTMLARIVQMVAEAQRSRAPIQRLADRVAGWFVPAGAGCCRARLRRPGAIWGPEPRRHLCASSRPSRC